MPLPTNPSFTQVRAFFNGSASFKDYYRGGPYVPDIPANAAISTTAQGLSLKQFSGADKITAPPAPTLNDTGGNDSVTSFDTFGQASVTIEIRTDGQVWVGTTRSGSGNQYAWLPSGRSASEYQYRTSSDSVTWSGWVSLGSSANVLSVSAQTDGFYSDYQSGTVYVQLGAQDNVLTGVATFTATATATGRD